ncbi:MAG: DNA polymerase I [Gammaproteobacteria bacterium]|nr:DNA polymerase I [Gammaproteobacteria bacterium]
MMKNKPLILIDGSSYLYRAFHAMPPLTNSHGESTGTVYGVINMLRKLITEYEPDQIAVIFDARGKTFRDDLYPEYKANRPSMPDELAEQIEPIHAIIRAMGLPILQVSGVEADDVIGTLARQASARGIDTLISTGDKDMAQLVDDHVHLINTMTNVTLDRAGVVEKFGVPPERIIELLGLMGDSSDNIPGVPKVGPKTAVKWLNQYGDADTLVAHADEIKGKVGESLRAHLDDLAMSRDLATIRCELDLELGVDDLAPAEADNESLKQLYARMEFSTWLREIVGSLSTQEPKEPLRYDVVDTEEQLKDWIERIKQAPYFALDTETTSLDYMQAEIVGVSLSVEPGEAAYIPLAHLYEGMPAQLDRDEVLQALKPILEDERYHKLGQHLKYDKNVLENHGITLRGIVFDTMLESYVADSAANRHNLDTLALKYLGHKMISYTDVAGKGAKQLNFAQVPIEQAAPYAAEDAEVALRLHQYLWPQIEQEPELKAIFSELELPLLSVLSRIERTGVLIDTQMLAAQSKEIATKLAKIEMEAYRLADGPFNLASPKQIQEILYQRQNLPVLAKTPKGAPSTAESVLQELALDYPLPKLILEYRALSKLKSTYIDKLPQQVDPRTGRVHTSYHQAVTATGRLSSSDPNLQNIPVRSEEGRRIRQAFIAAEGARIVAADYSQVELRIMAHLSADEGLLTAFAQGEDIHRATASEVFGCSVEAVTKEQRRAAKAINFGLIYGMSAFGLAKQLDIQRGQAQEYIDRYFQRYPGVKAYMERTREQAHADGYVSTVFGRRLYLPEINAKNGMRRQQAERAAINAPMQGTAADIIKRAMLQVDQWVSTQGNEVKLLMQVHDELVFEIAEPRLEEAVVAIRQAMESAAHLSVPLIVDIGVGKNWDEAH